MSAGGRPGGTRTPAPRFVRPPRCRCATGRWSTREDLNLRPPRYQRGAHTGPGSWSTESGRRDSNPRFPAPKAGGMAASLQPVASLRTRPRSRTGTSRRTRRSERRASTWFRQAGLRANDRPRTGYLLHGKQVRVLMRFIRVERRGIEPRRAWVQSKPGPLSSPLVMLVLRIPSRIRTGVLPAENRAS